MTPEMKTSPTKVDNRAVLKIALPAIAANLAIPLVGIVDTWAIGHLPGAERLGAIALASQVFSALFWTFGFLRMGTTGLAAQSYGRGSTGALADVALRGLVSAVVFGVLLWVLQDWLGAMAFGLFGAGEVQERLAAEYFTIRIQGAPFALAGFVATGWLIGTRRIGLAVGLQVGLNLANAVLSLIFVVGLGMGVRGVALGSLFAETGAGVLAIIILLRINSIAVFRARIKLGALTDKRAIANLFRINRDLFIRTLFLVAAFWIFTDSGARLGSVPLAANQILLNFVLLSAFVLDGYAHAAEALVGSAYGVGELADLRRAAGLSAVWASGTSIVLAIIYWVSGPTIIAFLTIDSEVQALASTLLPWVVVVPVAGIFSFQFDGIFIGATRTLDMMWTMIMAFAIYWLALKHWMPLIGIHGVWLAFIVFLLARGLGLAVRYPALERSMRRAGQKD